MSILHSCHIMCIILLQMKHVKDIVIAKMDATANGPPPNYSAGGCVKPLNFYNAYFFITYHAVSTHSLHWEPVSYNEATYLRLISSYMLPVSILFVRKPMGLGPVMKLCYLCGCCVLTSAWTYHLGIFDPVSQLLCDLLFHIKWHIDIIFDRIDNVNQIYRS